MYSQISTTRQGGSHLASTLCGPQLTTFSTLYMGFELLLEESDERGGRAEGAITMPLRLKVLIEDEPGNDFGKLTIRAIQPGRKKYCPPCARALRRAQRTVLSTEMTTMGPVRKKILVSAPSTGTSVNLVEYT